MNKTGKEKTLFFVKPYIEPQKAAEIIGYMNYMLTESKFSILGSFDVDNLSLSVWKEFYSQIRPEYPDVFEKMTKSFASSEYGLIGEVIEGKNIMTRVRYILGPRIIEDTDPVQIRSAQKYGLYNNPEKESYKTVAHASTEDSLKKDFRIFAREGIISCFA